MGTKSRDTAPVVLSLITNQFLPHGPLKSYKTRGTVERRTSWEQRVWASSEVLLCVSTPGGLELFQTLDALLHSALAMDFVISGTYIHCVARFLLLSHHFSKQGNMQAQKTKEINISMDSEKDITKIKRGNTRQKSERVCCHWPRMKLYCANCAFRIFLFRVQPGSRSTSAMKPLLWNSCLTCHINQRNNQQLKTVKSMPACFNS